MITEGQHNYILFMLSLSHLLVIIVNHGCGHLIRNDVADDQAAPQPTAAATAALAPGIATKPKPQPKKTLAAPLASAAKTSFKHVLFVELAPLLVCSLS